MGGHPQRIRVAQIISLVGMGALAFGIALWEGRASLGPLPLDAVTVTVPLALLASVPLLRLRGREGVVDTGIVVPALVFLAFALLSCVTDSLSVGTLLTFSRYLGYLLLTGAVAIIAREPSARRLLMWIVAAAGMATVIYGAWWYVTSLAAVYRAAEGTPVIALRVVSTFQNANFYSEFLVLLIGVLAYLVITEERLLRWIATGMALASGVMLLLTYTRGSWLGLLGAAVIVALAIAPRRAWAVLAVPVLIALMSPSVQTRLAQLITLEGSAGFRLRLWRVAGAAILAAPLTGSGIGTFYDAFAEAVLRNPGLAVGFAFYGAHNSYLTLLAETGVFGGLAFIVVVLAVLRVAARPLLDEQVAINGRLQVGAIATGLGAFALNALTSNSFQHPQAAVFFWLFAGVLVAVTADLGMNGRAATITVDSPERDGALARLARGSVAVSLASRASSRIASWWQAGWTRAFLLRPPAGDAAIVLSSAAGRLILGGPRQ